MENACPCVVVYCASSTEIDSCYFEAAAKLGRLLAKNGTECVTGAGREGLMGELNDSLLKHGGRAVGVIPKFMVDAGWCHNHLTETIVTSTIHERKEKMAQKAYAAIALPGGVGTLEELAEIITWKQLGLFNKPVILLNTNNYYDSFLKFLEVMVAEKFLNLEYSDLLNVVSTPEDVIDLLNKDSDWHPSLSKY